MMVLPEIKSEIVFYFFELAQVAVLFMFLKLIQRGNLNFATVFNEC
jgi:hypothetical protein